jgi:CheY-like chemotaxis protein/two-component sensor histidine kinase
MRLHDDASYAYERDLIQRNVRHLVRMVDDLLDMSRITRKKIQLRQAVWWAADLIADAAEIAQPTIANRSHRFSIAAPKADLPVVADRVRMTQAIANLLNNAAKYTEPGGEIAVTATAVAADVVIRVSDNGHGIAADALPRIFDLFFQAERTPDRSQGGLGIGLTVVKNIVALHGGSVTAHSAGHGHGTEVVIRLPRASQGPSIIAAAGGPQGALASKRVLVVEDSAEAAAALRMLLEAVGCTTMVAHDGAVALAAVSSFHPQLALLDLGLPAMDGYELARRLRSLDASLRIVAVTGYGQDSDRARTRDAGFDDHLVKPVELEALRAVLALDVARSPSPR